MWDAAKQEQFDALRDRGEKSTLTDDERQTLEHLFYELEQEEWRALGPALERLRQEKIQLQQQWSSAQTQNALLAAIAERQADLKARAKAELAMLLNEQATLNNEIEHALGQSLSDARQ